MNTGSLSSHLKAEARGFLAGKYLPFVMTSISFLCMGLLIRFFFSLIYSSCVRVFSIIPGSTVQKTIEFFFSALSGIFTVNLVPGLCLFGLKFLKHAPWSYTDLFVAYRTNFAKNITVSAILSLPRLLFLEPFTINYELLNLTFDASYLFPTVCWLLAGALLCLPVDLFFSVVFFLSLDFPDHSVKEIFAAAARLIKRNWQKMLHLEFSFLPVFLLCILSLGFGFLWGIPYIVMTYTFFYMALMTPSGQPSHSQDTSDNR